MTEKRLTWYWHIHHRELVDILKYGSILNRVEYIKNHKPESEIKLRLRLLQPVSGKIPEKLETAAKIYENSVWGSQVWLGALKQYVEALESPELAKLHELKCLDCPWDGTTIFPESSE